MRISLLIRSITLLLIGFAPALQAQPASISVSVEDPGSGESLSARDPMTIDGVSGVRYVELGEDADIVTLVFSGTTPVTNIVAPGSITVLDATPVPSGIAIRVALGNPASHSLRFLADQGGTVTPVDLYIARKPQIEIEAMGGDCIPGQICLATGAASRVVFGGRNLAEVDVTSGVVLGAQRFPLRKNGQHLHAQIPAGAITQSSLDVAFRTRKPYLDDDGTPTRDLVVQGIRVSQSNTKNELILRVEGQSSEPTVFVGQNLVLEIRVPDGIKLNPTTYSIEEMVGQQQRTVVGLLDVLRSGPGTATVRVLGLAPTVNDLEGHGSFVYLKQRDSTLFHSRLSVQHRPAVAAWTIHHVDSRHRDQNVHPGETVLLTLVGRNLRAFNTVEINGNECVSPCAMDHPSPDEMRVRFPFAAPPVDRVPILLKSDVARDTTILLPTAPALQPRPLDFVTLVVDSVRFRPRLVPAFPFFQLRARDSTAYSLLSARNSTKWAGAEIGTNTLHGVRVVIDPAMLDQGGRFGIQHLIVAATLLSPDREKVEEDSIRLAIAPPDSTLAARLGLTPAAHISPRVVSIDELIDRLGRFSQPGSVVEISIRHDSARYGGDPGYRKDLRVRNDTRYRVRPHAEVLAGAFYIARTRGPRLKTPVPNGAPADTVSRRGEQRTGFDALSLLGSLGVDASVLNHEGRPTFARIRVGLLAMQSPFDSDSPRQFGLSFLYPMELATIRGGVALSISAGGICLANERCFALVSPGFSMTLGK